MNFRRPHAVIPTRDMVLAASADNRTPEFGVAAPCFKSLCRLTDKVTTARTLLELELPQPEFVTFNSAEEMLSYPTASLPFPVVIKEPFSNDGSHIYLAKTSWQYTQWVSLMSQDRLGEIFERPGCVGSVLVQKFVEGTFRSVQGIFDQGHLVA
ncbi:hypothetical protein B0T25DRAFT_561726 [Lasiosphaeria hispida]|uniref:ATP-grasp domain-containing protein n=1 Tax=Lasiosphaeria hispida TaxID=260671 RepID=A0AAJ0MJD0_9PEZI|nr:hypothetical protein B0T25DRAFT_561726 [Lasiosphaeria hispida]